MPKKRRKGIQAPRFVPIVADGALAGPVAGGLLVPVLLVDTSQLPQLAEFVRVHEFLPPGDVNFYWAASHDDPDAVALIVKFVQPIRFDAAFRFSIEHQGILVESMLTAGAVYLQPAAVGDRFATTLDKPRIIVELPDTGFRDEWDNRLLARMTVVMAQRSGLTADEGRQAAADLIAETRRLVTTRLSS